MVGGPAVSQCVLIYTQAIMGSRWFNLAIVLVWLSTTTWLVVAKILPPLRRGEPPNYHSMYDGLGEKKPPPVAWDMSLNGKSLGYAVVLVQKTMSGDMTEVESRIHFEHVPLAELSPAWMKALFRSSMQPSEDLRMFVGSHLTIDKLGYLSEFNSRLRVAGMQDAIRIKGTVHGSLLKIVVRAGELEYPFETFLPSDSLVTDELSPQLCLTGLRVGQEWTVPVFSPMRPPNNPVDVLQARVERRDLLMWEGKMEPVDVVEYRTDSGSALSSTSQARARLWVRTDGIVLKQEVSVLGSEISFVRLSPDRSADLYAQSTDEEPEFRRRSEWPYRRRWSYGWPQRPGLSEPQGAGSDEPKSTAPADSSSVDPPDPQSTDGGNP
jgi:hypothetical protein